MHAHLLVVILTMLGVSQGTCQALTWSNQTQANLWTQTFLIKTEWLCGQSPPTVGDKKSAANFPDVGSVYLAGTWNDWGENNDGYVTNPKFLFSSLGNGHYSIAVPLPYGMWAFKIVTNNNMWWSPKGFQLDNDGNALVWLDDKGVSLQPSAQSDSKSESQSFIKAKQQIHIGHSQTFPSPMVSLPLNSMSSRV